MNRFFGVVFTALLCLPVFAPSAEAGVHRVWVRSIASDWCVERIVIPEEQAIKGKTSRKGGVIRDMDGVVWLETWIDHVETGSASQFVLGV